MNVLVVEDDPSAQKILKLFLERSGYKAVLISDGAKALELMVEAKAPPVVILDWLLPGMDGTTICKKLREMKLRERPYILMLSSKSSKEDIAVGLDAGADDFVSKPFNVSEMQARLRVAWRTIEYQRELQKQIEDNEVLNQRNDLLSELITRQPNAPSEAVPSIGKTSEEAGARPHVEVEAQFSTHEIRFLLSATMLELKLVLEGVQPREGKEHFVAGDYCAWAGLLIPRQDFWFDLAISAHPDSVSLLFEKSLGRRAINETEKLTLWSETVRRIALSFLRNLHARGAEVLLPLPARAQGLGLWRGMPPLPMENKSYDLTVDAQALRLNLSVNSGAKQSLMPDLLEELDVLADPYPKRDTSAVALFNEGVVLTPRFIDRIAYHAEHTRDLNLISVYRPSAVARFFSNYT